ncbi:hemolysin III [Ahniella affigens]|uniref:Hemolysin III n=1 Tax=Ahniella affigens TaxID=2021234 RepID=A0A2P1PVX9_9GAMM|nr:hemolysin III family protein [Ahniella affigens]AVP99003.1 hemolysin III [Ahniella affigens]
MSEHHSLKEEVASALTHGLGVVAALCGSSVLITLAALHGNAWQLGSAIVYGITLILLYVASTLYHAVPHPVAKARLKVFDHCAIYLLIAGTYTPITLIALRGNVGWWLFGAIWGLAMAGVLFKLFFTGRFKRLSTMIYIAMGWLVIVAIKPVINSLSVYSLVWLFVGGAFYTAGTYFYHRDNMRYAHAIWHVFVLLGSVSHYITVASLMTNVR